MQRKNIRLSNHDYSAKGIYFITICTKNREFFFGEIVANKMILSPIGMVAEQYLKEIPKHFNNVKMDEFVVMPNHIHCLINVGSQRVGLAHVPTLPDNPIPIGSRHVVNLHGRSVKQKNQFGKPVAGSVSVIMQQFKSSVKRWCNKNNHANFEWQSRFYDHIVRNEESLFRIKNYIYNNVKNWKEDSLNGQNEIREDGYYRK
jgi:REP element-mobilizing transposase RayT